MTWFDNARRLAIFGLGSVGTYFGATFAGVVNAPDLADPKQLACIVKDEAQWLAGKQEPASTSGVRVLVARLDLDDDYGRQTRHVVDSLRKTPGFEVRQLCRTLALSHTGDSTEEMKRAAETGRKWLHTQNAAILVWGQVEADKAVSLRILTPDSEQADRFLTLDDDLKLPKDFNSSLSVTLAASVLSQTLALTQGDGQGTDTGRRVSGELLPMLPQLRALAENADTLGANQGKNAREAYLSALVTLTGQTGDLQYAEEARTYADAALPQIPAGAKVDRATTSFWRARAINLIASRNGDIALMQEAAQSYRNLTSEWTREKSPREWARAQNYYGSALRRLGQWQGDDALIEEAIAAHKVALASCPREKMPLDWSRTQNSLGQAYRALGEKKNDATLLQASVTAFESALLDRKRAQVPLNWASAQSSLGTALTSLGEIQKDPLLLGRAVTAYQSALEVRTRKDLPLSWATTQDSLAGALLVQGRLANDDSKIDQAVTAYRGALEVRTSEKAPVAFADTQSHLSEALGELAGRRHDVDLYGQAIDSLSAAITIYDGKGMTGPAAGARRDLADLETKRTALANSKGS